MLCNKPYVAMLCCPITEILVQLIDFIIRLLVYEGSIEKLLIYAHYRVKPCLQLSFVILFICMIGHILHLYFETRYSFYTLLNLKLNLVNCRNDSRKASTLLLDTRSLAVDVVVGLLIFRKIKSLV